MDSSNLALPAPLPPTNRREIEGTQARARGLIVEERYRGGHEVAGPSLWREVVMLERSGLRKTVWRAIRSFMASLFSDPVVF